MRRVLSVAVAISALFFLSACGGMPPVQTASASSPDVTSVSTNAKASSRGQVFLIRGGLNVFSTGMDALAGEMRTKGINARSDGHAEWKDLAAIARRNYAATKGPIVLIGHSYGALAAVLMAGELQKTNTPVALIIFFDVTEAVTIPANVRRVVNIMSGTSIGLSLAVTGGPGFRGRIDPVKAPQYDHMNLDEAPTLHQLAIAEVLKVIRPSRAASR
jgi:pimeloyl-ACP methyl ester carboxylesterase